MTPYTENEHLRYKMMRLHVVIYSELLVYGGGRETWLSYFLPSLARSGRFADVYVYYVKAPEKALEHSVLRQVHGSVSRVEFLSSDIGIPELGHPIRNGIRFGRDVERALRKRLRRGDTILLVGTLIEALAGLWAKLLHPRDSSLVTWVRSISVGELATRRSKPYVFVARMLERALFRVSARIIANGLDTLAFYGERYPHYLTKMLAIPNAVDYHRFDTLPLPDFDSRPLRIGFIGRLAKAKGFQDFLYSVEGYWSSYGRKREIEFHIWGPGTVEEKYTSLDLQYHGPVRPEEMPATLASCHVVLILNHSAKAAAGGLSHGLLEAMAAGRLIVAWDNPAHAQAINHETAILLPEGSIDALIRSYSELLTSDRARMTKMATTARKRAQDFSIQSHIDQFLSVIESIRR